jgi:hypothetical protein
VVYSDDIKADDVARARDLLQAFLKARKNLRIYPSNNPMYAKTVDDIFRKFADFFEGRDKLDLKIARNEIVFEGETVFFGEGKEDNLALFFFRDGLRELVFGAALERGELQRFLEIMAVDFDSEDVEDDIVTLLWEEELPHISYKVDETVLVDDHDLEEKSTEDAMEGAMDEEQLLQAHHDALSPADEDTVPLMTVTEEDLKALVNMVERDVEDKTLKFIDMLFDMMSFFDSVDEYKETARILNNTMDYCVRKGNFPALVTVLKKAREAMENSSREDLGRTVGIVLSYPGTSAFVNIIGDQLESGIFPEQALFDEFVRHLGVNALPSFMSLLGELENMEARKFALHALVVLGKKDLNAIVRGLRDSRWYVVRNVVYILRRIGDKRALDPVSRAAGHEDVRVRREALRAVGELGGPAGIPLLREYLSDSDKTVRLAAVKGMGAARSELAKEVGLEEIRDRRFLTLEIDEMKSYFEVLAQWPEDGEMIAFLGDLLDKNPLLKRGKHNELKACAVYCLGLMGNTEFLDVIEKLRDAKSQVVSEHAYAAMKRIRYGR